MPFGPEPLGLAYFAAVKLAGYSAFGGHLRKKFGAEQPRAIAFGAARTVLGLIVGIGFVALLAVSGMQRTEMAFYVLLLPVRFGEWLLAIWFFFSRRMPLEQNAVVKQSVYGSVVSYLLDVPAIASVFILPGGAWIC
jgi:hypothetical protein